MLTKWKEETTTTTTEEEEEIAFEIPNGQNALKMDLGDMVTIKIHVKI